MVWGGGAPGAPGDEAERREGGGREEGVAVGEEGEAGEGGGGGGAGGPGRVGLQEGGGGGGEFLCRAGGGGTTAAGRGETIDVNLTGKVKSWGAGVLKIRGGGGGG